MAADRPLRADAQRNRDRLLEVAVRAFSRGSEDGADVTLDAIAKEAGVGIGTLYRHFPPGKHSSRPPTATSCRGWATRSPTC